MIHPTAIVDKKAEIDHNVEIGPYSIVKENVVVGKGTMIGPHVVIDPYTTIGSDCKIFQFASIGAVPQDKKFKGEKTVAKIGNKAIIREFVTINRGTELGGGITEVGEESLLMAYAHIAHDCVVGKKAILANCATLAGHVILGDCVTVGGLAAVQQFVRIGDYAYIGGTSAVLKDIPPYVIASGEKVTLHGLNKVGLKRHGVSDETLSILKNAYKILFRIGLTMNEALERVAKEVEQIPEVVNLVNFIKTSERGITR